MLFNVLLVALCIALSHSVFGTPIPIGIDLNQPNTSNNLTFALNLPNNDTVTIGLSFKLLSYFPAGILKNTSNVDLSLQNDEESSHPTQRTTTTLSTLTEERNIITVEEAIEKFRQDLIKKEIEISGIIQSKDIFYRHFKLEFNDDQALTIRCTYDSNYNLRTLNIKCYEYHEYETERVLSNGEVEVFIKEDLEYKSDVELIDFKKMKQVYTMNVS